MPLKGNRYVYVCRDAPCIAAIGGARCPLRFPLLEARDFSRVRLHGYITSSSVTDIWYLVHRHTHSNIESRKILSKLLQLYGILDTTAEDCLNALHTKTSDYEDAVMMETAFRSGMDRIVTRNIDDYRDSRIQVLTPGEFLNTI